MPAEILYSAGDKRNNEKRKEELRSREDKCGRKSRMRGRMTSEETEDKGDEREGEM